MTKPEDSQPRRQLGDEKQAGGDREKLPPCLGCRGEIPSCPIEGACAGSEPLPAAYRRLESELESRNRELHDLGLALNAILDERVKSSQQIEATIVANIRELVFPYLEKLKRTPLSDSQAAYVRKMEVNLNDIASPLLQGVARGHTDLSPVEMRVARLIQDGKSSSEIAKILGISINTVLSHRYHLRTKLGLKNEKINLRSFLKISEFQ